ncbi:hypothetical protein [Larkinella humicola]|uniref:Oxygen tolerance protein BatD n=1 Tax=Larkinella humicola TaxID=2607654 RepID=A0A5N1JDY7_9BACT|nr:hypothetical protein [Larkinella humicola]KAA9347864.1 hypothetical protein F0P93_24880 [Larkinella humicola]
MNVLFCGLLLCSLLGFARKPEIAPKAPFTGMTTITWIGFDKQTSTSPVPVGVTNLAMPSLVYPKKIEGQNIFYQEVVLVNPTFKPANPITKPPTQGNWFVRRQVLRVKDGKTDVLQTTNLAINKNAAATSLADLPISINATHVEYRIGRTEKVIGKLKPGEKTPKISTTEVYPHDAVRVAIPMSAILANTCSVKFQVIRPIPCEFQTVRFQILGKNGNVLYETSEVKGAPIKIADQEAKKTVGPNVFFDARWIVKRIHKPNYPVKDGYQVMWGQSGSDFNAEVDSRPPMVTGLQLDETVGKEFTIPVELMRASTTGGFAGSMRELLLENDVTKTKFPVKTQAPAAPRSDCYIQLNW